MTLKRREFINISAVAAGTGLVAGLSTNTFGKERNSVTTLLDDLQSMAMDIKPITTEERINRIEKAQELLKAEKIKALVLDAGTSLKYFTGITWWPSERPMVVIIPAIGQVCYICPGFEESRLNELIKIGTKVYAWQEDESPYKLIAKALKDLDITSGNIGMEEYVRFFILDGIKQEASHFNFVSGDPITIPCRLVKSSAEIALMQKANDITTAAIKIGIAGLKEGMQPSEFSAIVAEAHEKLGATNNFASANFGEASALPHGSSKPQYLKKGDIVLIDCGCHLDGYCSDISRTIVFGMEPNAKQKEIWSLEKKAQLAGFSAAKLGAACENVDAAARKVLSDAGFGPDYKLPGLPHRTGHGIGMDVHEWGNIVRGNKLPLKVGMCFSIEPNISIVGEFGIRHEDCVYMTEDGPKWFSQPSLSINQPFVE
jgi:Xaa-Pro dipeptidase